MTVDDLSQYGVERMDEESVRGFLASQNVGVLGLAAESAPYLLPLSFGYDGASTLYFTFVVGEDSEKDRLARASERASFLVFSARTMFNWESVSLRGDLVAIPESDWGDVADALENVWRPEAFARATDIESVRLYAYRIDEMVGIRHTGLPPGFEAEA